MYVRHAKRRDLVGSVTVQALLKSRPARGFELADVPVPTVAQDEVLLSVGAASICGSDRYLYEWSADSAAPLPPGVSLPVIAGHEVAGTIVEVGSSVTQLTVGQRVAVESHLYCGRCFMCRTGNAHVCTEMMVLGFHWDGAFAEQLKVPASVCFPLPDSISLDDGALFEPVGVAVHAIQRAGSLAGASVLVNGSGPIGLYIIQLALLFGAARVFALEIDPFRRALAQELGAEAYDPRECDIRQLLRELTGRRGGTDVTFEVTGVPSTVALMLECTRTAGTLVAVGLPGTVELDVSREIIGRSIALTGVFGRRLWDTWELLLGLVVSGRLQIESIVTDHFELRDFDRAMERLQAGAGKVIIHP